VSAEPVLLGALRDLAERIGRPVDAEDRVTILRAAGEIERLREVEELPGDGQLRYALKRIDDQVPSEEHWHRMGEHEPLPALEYLSPGERAAAHEALLKGREHEPADQYDTAANVWETEQCGRIAAEAAEVLDNLLESLQRVSIEGQTGDVEDFDAALDEARDLHKRLGDPQQEHLHALRAQQHAEVLAKALDQFFRGLRALGQLPPSVEDAVDALEENISPAMRALGHPADHCETP
jgi:hypothetical protein